MKPINLLLAVAAVTAALTNAASAKGGFNIVTLAGPDWYGEIDITDPDLLQSLDMGHFLNLDRPIDAPAQVGRGYLITRGYLEGSVRHMFDRIVYFPGSPSFAYYLEILNGAGPMDGNWYTVSEQGDWALAARLQKHGVSLPKPVLGSLSERPAGGVAAIAGELAEVALVEAIVAEIASGSGVEPSPVSVGGPEPAGLMLGAILLGSMAGWALRGMRLRRMRSIKR